jgi:hypothetical protein
MIRHLKTFKKGDIMSEELIKYFNKQPRIGTLSTASKEGKVDIALFGSPNMINEKTIVMGLGRNRKYFERSMT